MLPIAELNRGATARLRFNASSLPSRRQGFADPEEAANNPSILFDSVLLSFLLVRFWSALSFDRSVYGFGSHHIQLPNMGPSKCWPQASTSAPGCHASRTNKERNISRISPAHVVSLIRLRRLGVELPSTARRGQP
jgi:hypothetical protein